MGVHTHTHITSDVKQIKNVQVLQTSKFYVKIKLFHGLENLHKKCFLVYQKSFLVYQKFNVLPLFIHYTLRRAITYLSQQSQLFFIYNNHWHSVKKQIPSNHWACLWMNKRRLLNHRRPMRFFSAIFNLRNKFNFTQNYEKCKTTTKITRQFFMQVWKS